MKGFILVWSMFSLIVLSLSGCVRVQSHVTIHRDGSAEVAYVLAMEASMLAMMQQDTTDGNPIEEVKAAFAQEGFTVTEYAEGKYTGVRVSKQVDDVTQIGEAMRAFDKNEELAQGAGGHPFYGDIGNALSIHEGWFTTKYALDLRLDLRDEDAEASPLDGFEEFGKAMAGSLFDMSFVLTLPMKPTKTNAPTVSNDGRTLEWPIALTGDTVLQVEATVPNVRNIGLTAAAGLLVVFGVVLGMVRRQRAPVAATSPKNEL